MCQIGLCDIKSIWFMGFLNCPKWHLLSANDFHQTDDGKDNFRPFENHKNLDDTVDTTRINWVQP
jgi:hypothetical protein